MKHYYLKDNRIWMATTPLPLKHKFRICLYSTFEDYYDAWLKSLQPCEISESELDKVTDYIFCKKGHDELDINPIEVTDIISDNNGVITFKEKLIDINLDVKDYILNKYPHLKREGKNPIIDFELLDLCNFIDEYTNAKVEEFKIKQAKFLIENFSNKQFDGEIEAEKMWKEVDRIFAKHKSDSLQVLLKTFTITRNI